MQTADGMPSSTDEVRCSYHPSVYTRLRCSRCGRPICPKCGVRTPVGLRCPECAGVRGLPTYRTDSTSLFKGAAIGLAFAVAIGVLWGFIPDWNFYLCLAIGFTVAEMIARVSNGKRGHDLQAVAIGAAVVGMLVSRVVLAQRLGVTWEDINGYSTLIQNVMYLRLIPDALFAGLAVAICWYRFR
jgi:hypothetical protein